MKATLALIVSALAIGWGANAQAQPADAAKITPGACRDQIPHDTRRCFSVDLAEDPAHPQGRRIQLDGFVIPATAANPDRRAVVILQGGPGEAASESGDFAAFWAKQLPDRDIVAIDQRGTGRTPDIRCRSALDDAHLQPALIDEWPMADLKACLARLAGKVDLTKYTTANSAIDMELERRALGYDHVDLVGGSYGTMMAQAYIHLYGEHVRSAVLISVVSPDTPVPQSFARHTEMSLQGVLDLCIEDVKCRAAFPDIEGDLALLKAKLARDGGISFTWPEGANGKRMRMSAGAVAGAIRSELYDPSLMPLVPIQIHTLAHGDDPSFVKWAILLRRGIDGDLSQGLYLSITCGESWPHVNVDALRREEKGTLYGSYRTNGLAVACAVWPHGDDLAELHTLKTWNGPVLETAGQFDPVTPQVYAERVLSQFPHGRLLRLPNQGHGMTDDALACVAPLAAKFIETGDAMSLDARCAETLKFPGFVLDPAKAAPPPRPGG
jgi:pimeloyl-ACP methyl ester carboxylesterase